MRPLGFQKAAPVVSGHPKTPWSNDRIETLKQLWENGWSASNIADHFNAEDPGLGLTRNAVIGKVSRLKLPGRTTQTIQHGRQRAARPKKTPWGKPWRAARGKPFVFAQKTSALREIIADIAPLPPSQATDIPRKTLQQLQPGDCKFPCAPEGSKEEMFCAEERVEGAPYCKDHARRCFQPPTPRRTRPDDGVHAYPQERHENA
jgi:GcrA cell cycle regulator